MNTHRVDGTMATHDGIGVVTVSSVFPTTADDLWQAVTSPDRLRRWFGELTRREGETTAFDADLTTGWAGTLTVTSCEPPALLRAELRDAGTTTTVTARLEPTGGGTRLTIEERGLPTGELHVYLAGWHAQLDQLDAVLGGRDDVPWRGRWQELSEHYRPQPLSSSTRS